MREEDMDHQDIFWFRTRLDKCINVTGEYEYAKNNDISVE